MRYCLIPTYEGYYGEANTQLHILSNMFNQKIIEFFKYQNSSL